MCVRRLQVEVGGRTTLGGHELEAPNGRQHVLGHRVAHESHVAIVARVVVQLHCRQVLIVLVVDCATTTTTTIIHVFISFWVT